jgi:hypothetical protein
MSAFLKIYTDSGHTSEVAHTTDHSTTISSGSGTVAAGATSLTLTSTTGWPTSGNIDIIDGTNGNETIQYYGLSGTTIQLATATANQHSNASATINQWYYQLAVGDQTNGIPNDGTESTPQAGNTNTWYIYNAGDQVAQSITLATSNASPSTSQGYSDTVVSITSSSSGFSTSVSPSNLNAGSSQQFWVCAEIPSGQSAAGNPQLCVINLTYSSI